MASFVSKNSIKEEIEPNNSKNEPTCLNHVKNNIAPAGLSISQSLLCLVLVFLTALLALFLVYLNFPQLDPSEVEHFRLPRNMEHARNLGLVLSRYTGDHFFTVFSGFILVYIFLQTFAIPGSIFLSILSGYLFPFMLALLVVCLCSAIGATCCYLISYMVGRRLVSRFCPDKAKTWASQVDKHRENLLSYLIFLRVTPFLPNWFINVVSPIINIPLTPFFIGTFLGVAPPSLIAIQTGTTLHEMSVASGSFSWGSVGFLGLTAALSLAPILLRNYFKSKLD